MSETEYYKYQIKILERDRAEQIFLFRGRQTESSSRDFAATIQHIDYKISRYKERIKELEKSNM